MQAVVLETSQAVEEIVQEPTLNSSKTVEIDVDDSSYKKLLKQVCAQLTYSNEELVDELFPRTGDAGLQIVLNSKFPTLICERSLGAWAQLESAQVH